MNFKSVRKIPSKFLILIKNSCLCVALLSSFNSNPLFCQDFDSDGILDKFDLDDDNDGVLDTYELSCSSTSGLLLDYSSEPANQALGGKTINTEIPGVTVTHSITGDYQIWEGPESTGQVFNIFRTGSSGFASPGVMSYDFSEPITNLDFSVRDLDKPGANAETVKIEAFYLGVPVASTTVVLGINVITSVTFPGFYEGTSDNASITSYNNSVRVVYSESVDSLVVTSFESGGSVGQGSLHTFEGGCADIDTDNDGIPNRLDLDSDGDGCYDSYEAGVTGVTNSGAVTDSLAATTPAQVGSNGLANLVETSVDSDTINYMSTYSSLALNSALNLCADTDNDGIPDLTDIDDDNDGILDAVESPSCFYTEAEALIITSVISDISPNGTEDINNTIDGNAATHFSFLNHVAVDNLTILEFETTTAVELVSVFFEHLNGSEIIENGGGTAAAKLQAWNGTMWVDLSGSLTNIAVEVVIPITMNTGIYSRYRLFGVDGQTDNAASVEEIILVGSGSFLASSNTKPVCNNDIDGDSINNHLDLDSDGDGCYDSYEAGVTGVTLLGATTDSLAAITPVQVGSNGLANLVETSVDSDTINYTSTYSSLALSNALNLCADTDNDGIPDLTDIDDDNDGILDAVESPSCFYTEAEASAIDTLLTDFGWNVTNGLFKANDGNVVTYGQITPAVTGIGAMTLISVKFPVKIIVSSIELEVGGVALSNGTAGTWRLEGWTGSIWEVLSVAQHMNTTNTTYIYSNTLQVGIEYVQYRVVGVVGNSRNNGRLEEVYVNTINYISSSNTKPVCNNDIDGDGINNHLDIDSDGDGCYDSYEAGVTGVTNSGAVTDSLAATTSAQVGSNGLANLVETSTDSDTINYTSTYSSFALSNALNLCADTDNDGIRDLTDIDDDNDGILDAVESPSCFYTETEALIITSVISDISPNGTEDINNTIDGNAATHFSFLNHVAVDNLTILEFETTTAVELVSVFFEHLNGSEIIENGGGTAAAKLQAWNGTMWVDLSGSLTNIAVEVVIPITMNTGIYSRYRLFGIDGQTDNAASVEEIILVGSGSFLASSNTKPVCNNDIDGDGVNNHLDLDSDGDGCYDSYEAGVTGVTNSGAVTDSLAATTSADVGLNGLADAVETAIDSDTINYTNNYSFLAIDSVLNLCIDTDNDGVPDLTDIDDDNDGILDVVECDNDVVFDLNFYGNFDEFPEQSNFSSLIPSDGSNTWQAHPGSATSTFEIINGLINNSHPSYKYEVSQISPQGGSRLGLASTEKVGSTVENMVVGQEYIMSFYWINCGRTVSERNLTGVEVYLPNGTTVNTTEYVYDNSIWYYEEITFTANANSAGVGVGLTKNGAGISVDFIKIRPVRSPYVCDLDSDGDGIPNGLDLDSDGDGCYDSYEAGVTGVTLSGTTTDSLAAITSADVGLNGLADAVETSIDSDTINYISTYSSLALSSALNLCADTDNDGVPDLTDIDDDNDGILDAVESPSCFYTEAEALIITSVMSDVSPNGTEDINNTIDGNAATHFSFLNHVAVDNLTILEFETTAAIELASVFFEHLNGSEIIENGGGTASAKLQAWDGTTWVDLTGSLTNLDVEVVIPIVLNTGVYSRYRLFGLDGQTDNAASVEEIILVGSGNFLASSNTKPVCNNDIDGDGIANHLDLDSDGDGCYDSYEAGVTGVTLSGATTDSLAATTSADVGLNGLANAVETSVDSDTINYASTYSSLALSSALNLCTDTDDDGIPDLTDIDDDNDGVLDAAESLTCQSGVGEGIIPSLSLGTIQTVGNNRSVTVTDVNNGTLLGTMWIKDATASLNTSGYSSGVISSTTVHFSAGRSSSATSDDFPFIYEFIPEPNIYFSNGALGFVRSDNSFGNSNYTIYEIVSSSLGDLEYVNYPDNGGHNGSTDFNVEGLSTGDEIFSGTNLKEGGNTYVWDATPSAWTTANHYANAGTKGWGVFNNDISTLSSTNPFVLEMIYHQRQILGNDAISFELNIPEYFSTPCSGILDTDNDGIPNHLDLDSDGDGCPDAVESGSVTTQIDTVSGPYGNNGLGMSVETNDSLNALINYTSTYDSLALDSTVNNCLANNPPIAVNDTIITNEDNITVIDPLLNDTDPEQIDSTSVIVIEGPVNGTIIIDPLTGIITYSPDANYFGMDTILYTVCDTGLPIFCDTAVIYITVNPVNDLPSTGNETLTINEDDPATTSTNLTSNNIDPDGTATTITSIVSSTGGGTTSITGGGTTIDYTPAVSFTGTDTIIYTVCDAGLPLPAACVNDTLFVTVNPVNDPPSQGNETLTVNEDDLATTSVDLTTNNIDPDGTVITVTTIVSSTGGGTTSITGGGTTIDYIPASNFSGIDTVIYTVCDAGLPLPVACVNDTLFVTVDAVNDVPSNGNETLTINEDDPATTSIDLTTNNIDPDGTATVLTTIVSTSGGGTVVNNGDGTINYTPGLDFSGVDTVIYTVCDAGLPLPIICVNDTLFVTVNPVNDGPSSGNETLTGISEDALTATTSSDLTVNNIDPDGTVITVTTIVSSTGGGTTSITGGGTAIDYIPASNFSGIDTVIYTVCDAGLPLPVACVNDTLFVTVDAVNDAPSNGNEILIVDEDDPATTSIDLTTNNIDPDGTATVLTTIVSTSGGGTVVNNGDGTIDYTPGLDFSGVDTVIYTVCDAGLPLPIICVNDTLFVTVNPVNDGPSSGNETLTGISEDALTATTSSDLTVNNIDPDGTVTTVTTIVSSTGGGTTSITGGGTTIDYIPASNFSGIDTVIYTVCDAGLPLPVACVNDTLFVTVDAVNDVPSNGNETLTINEDDPATTSIDLTTNNIDPDGTATVLTTIVSTSGGGTVVNNGDGTINYTPGLDFSGVDTVIYTVCDAGLPLPIICVNDTLFVTVNPVNDGPSSGNETLTGISEDALTATTSSDLTVNNIDPDGTATTVTTIVSSTGGGTTSITGGGTTIDYIPASNFSGIDTVIYTVCDAGLPLPVACVNDTLFVTVDAVNDVPSNGNETLTINEDDPATTSIDLTTNNIDPDGTATVLTTIVSTSGGGTVVNNGDGTINYTPGLDFSGVDTVIYTVCDAGLPLPIICVNDTLFVTVNPVNDPPIIDNEIISVLVNGFIVGDLTDFGDHDVDGNLITTTTPVDGPDFGVITINTDGTYTYTPNTGYIGQDTVIVEVCDDGIPLPVICVNDTIFITVTATNPPIATDNNDSSLEDSPVTFNVSNDDSDSDGTIDDSTVDLDPATPGIQSTLTTTDGVWTVNANGDVTFTPNQDYNGTTTISYTVNDNDGATSNTATLTVVVTPVNDGPVVDNETHIISEDLTAIGDLTDLGDSDVDGNLVITTTPLSGPNNGTIMINPDGSYMYTPNQDFNGIDTIVVTICDDGTPLPIICTTDTIFVTVNPINDSPSQGNEMLTGINEDALTVITSSDLTTNNIDPDGTTTTVTAIVSSTGGGTISITGGGTTIDYIPGLNFNGIDTVIYTVCDAGLPLPIICVNDTLFVAVNAVNDEPSRGNETLIVDEDDPITTSIDLTTNNIDPDGTATVLTTIVSSSGGGTIVDNGDGTVDYTPAPNFNGVDTVIYTVCDGGLPLPVLCINDTLFVTVNPTSDPPSQGNEILIVDEDDPATTSIDLITNNIDPDGTATTITTIVSSSGGGTIVDNGDGTIDYTPVANFSGIDTVVYTVCDGGLPTIDCVNDTLFVIVNPVNDAPSAGNEVLTVDEDDPVTTSIDLTANNIDPEGTTTVLATIVSTSGGGTIVDNGDGTVDYTPALNFNGIDTVIYTVCDAGLPLPGACVNDTLFVTVNPISDPPSQGNETLTINEDDPATTSIDLTTNNIDPDGTTTSVTSIVSSTGGGTVVDNGDGTIDYIPGLNFNGIDTVIYMVCDAGLPTIDCVNDTLFVIVNPVNDAPSAGNEALTVDEDDPVTTSIDLTANNIDPEGTTTVLTTIVSTSGGGTIVDNGDGTVDYTPALNFNGIDTVIYTVCDAGLPLPGACVNDTLFVTVNPVNDPPNQGNETLTGIQLNDENPTTSTDLTTNNIDPDGTITTVTNIVSTTGGGTTSITGGGTTIDYIPAIGFIGVDTVIYTVCDAGFPLPVACVNDTLFVVVSGCLITNLADDCDGDGVTNGDELSPPNGGTPTDPTDPCSYNVIDQYLASVTIEWNNLDCDGDGTKNEIDESPLDPCIDPTIGNEDQTNAIWLNSDCDGDGVINGDEITDGTNPNDQCDFISESISVKIKAFCGIKIPEGFSPNNDGTNDYFVIGGVEGYENASLTIFNRWGNKVYEAINGYDSNWNGTNQFGITIGDENLPTGTYFYILDLGEGTDVLKGYIYLKR